MKNRILMAAALLCAFFPYAYAQQTMGPIAVKGTISATGNIYSGSTDAAHQACTQTNGLCASGSSGTVTSVALSMPTALFQSPVTGSPITTSGTLAPVLASQAANCFFASPNGSAGTPSCRSIVSADLPTATTTRAGIIPQLPASDGTTQVLAGDATFKPVLAALGLSIPLNTSFLTFGNTGTPALVAGVTPNCAGATCPAQFNNGFTTGNYLVLANAVAAGDTAITFTSVAGYPTSGCGSFNDTGNEAVCWSGISGNSIIGVTRGMFGSTATSHVVSGSQFLGWVLSSAPTTSANPAIVVGNNSVATFNSRWTGSTFFNNNVTVGGQFQTNSGTLFLAGIGRLGSNYMVGHGVIGTANNVATTGLTTSISTTSLLCQISSGTGACPAGLYRVDYYVKVTTAGTSGSTVNLTIAWNDATAAHTCVSTALPMDTPNSYISGSCILQADGVNNISYSTSLSGSGTYAITATLANEQ